MKIKPWAVSVVLVVASYLGACKPREFNQSDENAVTVEPNGGVKVTLNKPKAAQARKGTQAVDAPVIFGRFGRDSACWYFVTGGIKGVPERLHEHAIPHEILQDNLKKDAQIQAVDLLEIGAQLGALSSGTAALPAKPQAFVRPTEVELAGMVKLRINQGSKVKPSPTSVKDVQNWFRAKVKSLDGARVSVSGVPLKDDDITAPVTSQEASAKWVRFSCPEIP